MSVTIFLVMVWLSAFIPLGMWMGRVLRNAREAEDRRIESEREALRAAAVKPGSLDIVA